MNDEHGKFQCSVRLVNNFMLLVYHGKKIEMYLGMVRKLFTLIDEEELYRLILLVEDTNLVRIKNTK